MYVRAKTSKDEKKKTVEEMKSFTLKRINLIEFSRYFVFEKEYILD